MMRKIVFSSIAALALLSRVSGQSSTLETAADSKKPPLPMAEAQAEFKTILVIPFDPKMYSSDMDKELVEQSGYDIRDLRGEFRYTAAGQTVSALRTAYPDMRVMMMNWQVDSMKLDVDYANASTSYKSKPLKTEVTEEEKGIKQLKEKVQKKKPEEEPGAKIQNGEIRAVTENREKYIAAYMNNPKALTYLCNRYAAVYVVFINEMNLGISPGLDAREISSGDYRKQAKLHYTVLDRFGNEMDGGVAKAQFSSTIKDKDRLITTIFPPLADQIAKAVPSPASAPSGPRTDAQPTETHGNSKGKQTRGKMDDY